MKGLKRRGPDVPKAPTLAELLGTDKPEEQIAIVQRLANRCDVVISCHYIAASQAIEIAVTPGGQLQWDTVSKMLSDASIQAAKMAERVKAAQEKKAAEEAKTEIKNG